MHAHAADKSPARERRLAYLLTSCKPTPSANPADFSSWCMDHCAGPHSEPWHTLNTGTPRFLRLAARCVARIVRAPAARFGCRFNVRAAFCHGQRLTLWKSESRVDVHCRLLTDNILKAFCAIACPERPVRLQRPADEAADARLPAKHGQARPRIHPFEVCLCHGRLVGVAAAARPLAAAREPCRVCGLVAGL